MGKITLDAAKEIYDLAKKVYEDEIGDKIKDQDANLIAKKYSIAIGSVLGYVQNFKCLRDGVEYKRTINGEATKYFLKKIYEQLGSDGLKTALHSVKMHLEYQKSIQSIENIRKIYDEFMQILSDEENYYPEEFDTELTEGKVKNS